MYGKDTSSQEREDGAVAFAWFLYNHVRLRLPREFYKGELKRHAINKGRTASIVEFGFREWPRHYRLRIHSDKQGCIVGYGVFRPKQLNGPCSHQQLIEHLKRCVKVVDRSTAKLWAWYRDMGEPLRDFSRQDTLIEVEKISKCEESTGDDAFRQASHDLARLAEALDRWYSEAGQPSDPVAAAPRPQPSCL